MKQVYVKTMLYAYPNVRQIIKRVDELVLRKSLSSMTDCSDCREQCEKIVKLTVQKGVLFEIKHYVELIVSRLGEEERAYIEYKYFRKKKKEEFNGVDFTSRNYFRKQQKLIEYIATCFEWLNLTNEWFEKQCCKVPYVNKLLQSVKLRQNACASGRKSKKAIKKEVA